MKQKIKKLLTCVGAVGALTMMLSVRFWQIQKRITTGRTRRRPM